MIDTSDEQFVYVSILHDGLISMFRPVI